MVYPEAGSAKGISALASAGREGSDSLQDVLEGRVTFKILLSLVG